MLRCPGRRRRRRAVMRAHLGREPFPDPPDGRLTRLDQQLGAVAADVEPQEVESVLSEVHDLCLVLVEGQTSGRQPFREPRLNMFGPFTGVAEHDHIVGVPDQRGDPGLVSLAPAPEVV